MHEVKVSILKRADLFIFAVLLSAATLAPLAGNQFVTGTIVNCALITAVCTIGVRYALLIGIIPSTIALATGLLPVVLSPAIPFIILGNAVLILSFDYLRRTSYWLGAAGGAVLKSGLLFGTTSVVISLLSNQNAAAGVAYMMSWPQLVTALAGGLAAFGILSIKKKMD